MEDGTGYNRITRSGIHEPTVAPKATRTTKPRRQRVYVTVGANSWLKREDVKNPTIVATLTKPDFKDSVNYTEVLIHAPALNKHIVVACLLKENTKWYNGSNHVWSWTVIAEETEPETVSEAAKRQERYSDGIDYSACVMHNVTIRP